MKTVKTSELIKLDKNLIWQIANSCDVTFDTARLLFYRGIDSVEKAQIFLSPGKSRFYNPFLLSGIEEAVSRIKLAKELNQSVLIFGDYDADGICATTILRNSLAVYGINARCVIPERDDGYGLNFDIISSINEQERIHLIITVDCGISDYLVVEKLKENGIDVIITDHHEPPEILPDCIKINPKLSNQQYPFQGLCGAGVAYKLACAIIGKRADDDLDFVALATVADSMDLIDENRSLVYEGLKIFNSNKLKLPFKYLFSDTNKTINSQTLAYQIAPRVNAGGRMGDAKTVLDLFSETDENRIFDLAVRINEYNTLRQAECDVIYKQAKQKIYENNLYLDEVILVADKGWKTGFIGIVAAKLVEDYKKPVIVFAGQDDFYKGSARSIEDINIYEAICSASHLLLGFGGHSQAAGISVSEENLENFKIAICDFCKEKYSQIVATKKVQVEWELEDKFPLRLAREIERLEPFGVGNKKPLFSIKVDSVSQKQLRANSPHYSFNTLALEMLNFNGEKDSTILSLPISKEVVFEANYSVFKGRESVKGYVKNIIPDYADFSAVKYHVFLNELRKLTKEGELSPKQITVENIEKGYGTLYVLSDVRNVNIIKEKYKNLSCSLFNVLDKNCENTLVISPTDIPENYKRVIYLDVPMQYVSNSFSTNGPIGYTALDIVDFSRDAFANVFNEIKKFKNRLIKDEINMYSLCNCQYNEYTFLTCLSIFIELGFFEIQNGTLLYNERIKRPLTDSKIYSKISILKESK